MMRATVREAAQVGFILNPPTVRPTIGPGDDWFDPAGMLADEKSVLLFDESGGQFFHWRGPGIYEAHSFYLVRGRDALALGREAIRRMFEEYGAEKIWRATPITNKAARWFNRQLGFTSLGIIDMPEYGMGPCELFERKA